MEVAVRCSHYQMPLVESAGGLRQKELVLAAVVTMKDSNKSGAVFLNKVSVGFPDGSPSQALCIRNKISLSLQKAILLVPYCLPARISGASTLYFSGNCRRSFTLFFYG